MLMIQKNNSLNNFEPRIIKAAKIQDDPKNQLLTQLCLLFYNEWEFKHLLLFEIYTHEIYKKFVYKHSGAI